MDNIENALQNAQEILTPWTQRSTHPETKRVDVYLDINDLTSAVRALVNARWGYLSAITGLDHPNPESADRGQIEGLYSFSSGAAIVTLRVSMPYESAVISTISGLIPSAVLYEWEFREMFGVEVIGLPFTGHLILPDNWPKDEYPLRKSFKGLSEAQKLSIGGEE